MSEIEAKQAEPPAKATPVLMGHKLLIEITSKPLKGSPFGPITLTVVPFNRLELLGYFAKERKLKPDNPTEEQVTAWDAEQVKIFTPRIKKWNLCVAPGQGVADINEGTVALMPYDGFQAAESALLGEGGELVGN